MSSAKWRQFCFGLNLLIESMGERLHSFKQVHVMYLKWDMIIFIFRFYFPSDHLCFDLNKQIWWKQNTAYSNHVLCHLNVTY